MLISCVWSSAVEDPSETFDGMRDKCDLYTLIAAKALDGITAPFNKAQVELIRKSFKLADVSASFVCTSKVRS